MDLRDWPGLGLKRYEAAFRENEIMRMGWSGRAPAHQVLSLTAGDLKDLGVVIVGHRH